MSCTTSPARILLVDLAQVHSDLVRRALEEHADLTVVGALCDVTKLSDAVAATEANFVIVGCHSAQLAERCRDLTIGGVPPDVLALPLDGSDALLVVVRPQTTVLGSLSAEVLVDWIRRCVSERASL